MCHTCAARFVLVWGNMACENWPDWRRLTRSREARIHVGRDLEREVSRAKKGNQPFEFLVLHCALPQIHELAYDLEVAGFVVPG